LDGWTEFGYEVGNAVFREKGMRVQIKIQRHVIRRSKELQSCNVNSGKNVLGPRITW
jgi:hypothetical protein